MLALLVQDIFGSKTEVELCARISPFAIQPQGIKNEAERTESKLKVVRSLAEPVADAKKDTLVPSTEWQPNGPCRAPESQNHPSLEKNLFASSYLCLLSTYHVRP